MLAWLNCEATTERAWYIMTIHIGAPMMTTAATVARNLKTLSPGWWRLALVVSTQMSE